LSLGQRARVDPWGGCFFYDDGRAATVGPRTSFGVELGVTEGGRITIGRDWLFSDGVSMMFCASCSAPYLRNSAGAALMRRGGRDRRVHEATLEG
jgi:hypothetical protein